MTDPAPRVRCPACRKRFRVDLARVVAAPRGLRSRCTGCGSSFRVRQGAGGLQVTASDRAPPPEAGASPARSRPPAGPPPGGPPPAGLVSGERLGRYEIDVLLARGGMGSIYRAFDPATNRHVALKVLRAEAPEEDRHRFQREVEVQGNVRHPHLMPIFDSGAIGATRWYAMELLDRPLSLSDVLELRRGPVPEVRLRPLAALEGVLRTVFLPLCEAVYHANAREGVLHRDLKPANVLVDRNGLRPFVIDFGVCTLLERKNERLAHLTRETPAVQEGGRVRVTGTLAWMPPEQARGAADRRGDVWGLGALLRYLLTGTPPYVPASRTGVRASDRIAGLRLLIEQAERSGNEAEAAEFRGTLAEAEASDSRSSEDLARDVLAGRYAPMPPGADAELSAIVAKAMDPDPSRRYRHALELRDEVLAWLDRKPLRAVEESTGTVRRAAYRGRLWLRRYALLLLGAAAVAAVAVLLARRQPAGQGAPTAEAWMRRARDASAAGRWDEARDLARRAIEADPKHEAAFEMLSSAQNRMRQQGLLDEARFHAARAEEAFTKGDDVAGHTELVHLRAVVNLLGDFSREMFPEVEDLERRAEGLLPLVVQGAPADTDLALLPVAPAGRVHWDAPKPAGPFVPRGAWVLRARRLAGEVVVPFVAGGPERPVQVTLPIDPGTLDAATVYVPAGHVVGPQGESDVEALLWDRTEATEQDYAAFLDSLPPEERRRRVPRVPGVLGASDRALWKEEGDRFVPPTGAGRRPVEGISLQDARAFARFRGKRLPTAAEWAWAATGPGGHLTALGPLAHVMVPGLRLATGGAPGDVGGAPGDRNAFGLRDMAGNLAEWTGTLASFRGTTGWFVMGGGYATDPTAAVVRRADPKPGWVPVLGVGVRCVREVPPR